MFNLSFESVAKKACSIAGGIAGYLTVPAYAAPATRYATSTALNCMYGPATGIFANIARNVTVENAGALAFNHAAPMGGAIGGFAGTLVAQSAITGAKYTKHKYDEYNYLTGCKNAARILESQPLTFVDLVTNKAADIDLTGGAENQSLLTFSMGVL